ncbi:MAG: class I SAM-dependent methyltransferase [Slackia sp.]|nr:class I SAM-dependent methyltransferase [Slackia sp.]
MTDERTCRTPEACDENVRREHLRCVRRFGTQPHMAQYFDGLSRTWEENIEPCGAKHDATAFLAGIKPGARVLDVGCGTGIMAQAYLDAGAAEIVALDVAPGMIEIARRKFAHEPRVRFECASVYEFEDEQPFDAFVVYNAYPHLMDKEGLARKAAALLAENGRFLVAHGLGRAAINAHHSHVPENICTHLESARESARAWQGLFAIDRLIDADDYYCFGGVLKDEANQADDEQRGGSLV